MIKHPTPILTADMVPYNAGRSRPTVFNAGVAKIGDEYLMVFRNDFDRERTPGNSNPRGTLLGLARSHDGVKWTVDPEPVITQEGVREQWKHVFQERFMPHEIKRVYDPRITVVGDEIVLCLAMDTHHGVVGAVAKTKDFKSLEFQSITAPDNRNMVLFPEKVNDQYVRLERPFPVYGRGKPEAFEIWSSKSYDLKYWGDTRLVLGSEEVPYTNCKIGPAAPPIRTEQGWLTTIHATETVDESLPTWQKYWNKKYYGGLIMLDLEDPTKVIGMARQPLLTPELPHELEGFRGSVIFPCGMILEDDGQVKIYYGAADSCVALATAPLDELLATIEAF